MRSRGIEPEPIAKGKKEYRKEGLRRRAGLDGVTRRAAEAKILHIVLHSPFYRKADTLFLYVSYGDEVDTHRLMEAALKDGKRVCCPKVANDDRSMAFYRIDSLEELAEGFHGIWEPAGKGQPCLPAKDSLVIMPGCAFDRDRRRIGYGGGFYDRFLAGCEEEGVVKAAVCFSCQILPYLPEEETDIRPDWLITEEGIW